MHEGPGRRCYGAGSVVVTHTQVQGRFGVAGRRYSLWALADLLLGCGMCSGTVARIAFRGGSFHGRSCSRWPLKSQFHVQHMEQHAPHMCRRGAMRLPLWYQVYW